MSEEGKRHGDHMVGGPYKEPGMQRMAARPPSSPPRYQLCHMGQLLAGEPRAGVRFVSRGHQGAGGSQTLCPALPQIDSPLVM